MSARQLWADRLRATTITLKHDPNFVAAKKKDAVARRAEELVGSSKVYLTENALKQCGRVMTTLTVATQILEVYAKPSQELKEEDNTVKFTIMVMTTIFLLGFMFGCWCACRCCRTVHAASPAAETTTTRARAKREARPAPTAAAAAAEVDEPDFEPDLQEPLLQTAPPTRTRTTPTPTPPTRFPQSIWVTQHGAQYHVVRGCTGLNSATSASQKFACCTCIAEVDGDGLRRRAR